MNVDKLFWLEFFINLESISDDQNFGDFLA